MKTCGVSVGAGAAVCLSTLWTRPLSMPGAACACHSCGQEHPFHSRYNQALLKASRASLGGMFSLEMPRAIWRRPPRCRCPRPDYSCWAICSSRVCGTAEHVVPAPSPRAQGLASAHPADKLSFEAGLAREF